MTDKENKIFFNVAETIMEMPVGYQAGGQTFYMYPPSLGTTFLIERLLKENAEENYSNGSLLKLLMAVRKNKAAAVKLIAICSFCDRADACKTGLLKEREEAIKGVKDDVLMQLILSFTAWTKDVPEFIKHFGLDKEQEYIKRCYDVKDKNDGSLTFNGRTAYGTIIDVACERYGWTMEYVVWGISLNNLQMLMADHVVSVYMTTKERAKSGVPKDRRVIKMDKMTKEEFIKMRKKK
ncbi:MAG: hypothetical protein IJ640_00850 [Prevotella sp.]|nr:hypothetical protein [Prevotella sp.]